MSHARYTARLRLSLVLAAVAGIIADPSRADLGWAELPPMARAEGGAVYDPALDRVVIVGGLNDVIIATPDAPGTFVAMIPSVLLPPTIEYASPMTTSGIYDAKRDRILFVTAVSDSYYGSLEVWALQLGAHPSWVRLSTATSTWPYMSSFSIALDTRRDRLLIYGGAQSYRGGGGHSRGDLGAFDLATNRGWYALSPVNPLAGPLDRFGHGAVYD